MSIRFDVSDDDSEKSDTDSEKSDDKLCLAKKTVIKIAKEIQIDLKIFFTCLEKFEPVINETLFPSSSKITENQSVVQFIFDQGIIRIMKYLLVLALLSVVLVGFVGYAEDLI